MRKAIADRGSRHGLQPEPLDGLLGFRVLNDVTENQFTFAPGVARIHDGADILALDELDQNFQPRLILFDGEQIKVRRNDGQVGERPFAALHLELFRHGDGEQMADRRRDDVLVIFVEVRVLLKLAERLGNVPGDRRFFGDDECFAHLSGGNLAEKKCFVNSDARLMQTIYRRKFAKCKRLNR